MSDQIALTSKVINSWADDPKGPVALHLKQKLIPVEGEGGVIFPATYADIGYNIDTLSDGTKVAMVDSVGSQANRMEPIFKTAPYSNLVPQVEIEIYSKEQGNEKYVKKLSLLDLAHRSADAVVYSSPTLAGEIAKAFTALSQRGDAGPLVRLAPTSLVFGVWDSRGGTAEKRPRLVRSVIRALDVEPLYAAAQFNSVWKSLDSQQQDELKNEATAKKVKLSEKGFADAPATFRKVSKSAQKYMQEFRDGAPNPERRVLGGIVAKGGIERDITINLVALRNILGKNDDESQKIRRYLLALALISASTDMELFLREGCHLRYADEHDVWSVVPRRGSADLVSLNSQESQQELIKYAEASVSHFKEGWPKELSHKFDIKAAKNLLAKKEEDDDSASE